MHLAHSLVISGEGQRNTSRKLNFYSDKTHFYVKEDVFCSGEICPDSTVTKQQPQSPGLFAMWYLSGRCWGCESQKAHVHPGFLWPSSLSQLEQRRKTQPLLEQNVLVKTTDLPNFKHLLIKAMPRKQDLFSLISIETLSHASFLSHAQTTASMSVQTSRPTLLVGSAFFSQHNV